MNDDAALLRRYADSGSEAAFAEVVRHHVDFVYGTALRRTNGASDLAADVAQTVFTQLARKARSLSDHPALAAWLHTATRYAAATLMTSEQRRKNRERAALALEAAGGGAGLPPWEEVKPVLDAAIDELPEQDRTVVVLRFLEKRPFAEVGAALRVTEDAARMRTERALDKLRAALARRGITSSAAALATVVAAQPSVAAPAGLATALASAATTASGAGLLASLFFVMSTKVVTTAAICALLALGLGAYLGNQYGRSRIPPPPLENPEQARTIASLRSSNGQLRADIDRLNAEISRLNLAKAAAPVAPVWAAAQPSPQLLAEQRQKATLNNLRQLAAASDQFFLENGTFFATQDDLVGPTKYVKQLISVGGESYPQLFIQGIGLIATTPEGVGIYYAPGSMNAKGEYAPGPAGSNPSGSTIPPDIIREATRLGPEIAKARAALAAAPRGQPGQRMRRYSEKDELLPYFDTPQLAADYVELSEAIQKFAQTASRGR